MIEEDSDSSGDSSESGEEQSWIEWFVSLRGNEFFATIDESYIQDNFNLTGLSTMVPYYEYALDLILDSEPPLDSLPEDKQEVVETAAEVLYGLIHARYILTNKGMLAMYEKYQNADFGRCPRVYCQGHPGLPVGLSDLPCNYSVNIFCPRCHELYYPRASKHANIDGAFFGSTFSHLFLLQNPDLIPPKPQESFMPRIYGFRINKESAYYKQRENQTQGKRRIANPAVGATSGKKQSSNTTTQPTSQK
eukprot:CAMPEP_0185026044 /NCGR_PEP_ID=MMETSP1103-20130426/9661_1 /TAXON_ID=36769 /ORGANISM="Paraphysomonas bandaiensis, Strain Caron Lab Isolate" /LENGTH=248 /DNA_ID=CAMNT_0027559471 /DNA_START=157 /DNA_END=903 /DNA_ORIENTATION=-